MKRMNLYDAFEVYSMVMDDIISRNPQFFLECLQDSYWDKFVDFKDIAVGDSCKFPVRRQRIDLVKKGLLKRN